MNGSNDCTWPEMKQRAHYVSWLAAAIAAAALLGLTADLVFVQLTGGTVGLDLAPLLGSCILMPPGVYVWRKYGETACGFLELEHALESSIVDSDHGRTRRFARIAAFIARIDATGGMDRQLVRNEAKAWLLAHAEELTHEERDYVADHLGYLHRR